ncbi:MAG: DUF4340 domain-containing protein [Candidatus Omnitrophota bacterium]
MKLVRTLVFILVFALAVAVYLFQVRINQQALKIVPDEVNRKVSLSKDDPIDRVELRDLVQNSRIVLQKEKGAWMIEAPIHYPAEGSIVEGFAMAARMASQQPRMRAEKEWGEYGLAKPEIEVSFGLSRKKSATLSLGASAPVGKAVFARWDEERGFFLLPPEMKSMFRKSVYELRQKSLFRTPVDKIRKVYVQMGKYSAEWKKDGDTWYWLEPVEEFGKKITPEQMNLVLGALKSLHAREFLDANKKSRAELGFFMIHDCIWVELEDGKKEAFYFGNEVPEENAYYGLLEGEQVVFFVDRVNVIGFFDLVRAIRAANPKPQPKDMTLKL